MYSGFILNMFRSIGRSQIPHAHISRRCFHSSKQTPFKSLLNLEKGGGDQSYIVKRTLNHSPKLFYEVVSDVSSYSEFVPYCTRSFINKRDNQGQPSEAGLRVGWRSFDEEFVCDLQCEPESVVIAESISHSLFEHLYTKWTITPTPRNNSCHMELVLKYKFKSSLYNSVSSMFAQSVSALVIKAFDKRAADLRRREIKLERQKHISD